MKKLIVTALALCASTMAYAKVDTKLINKKPSADDVMIAMPCNMHMAFKKVYTGSDKLLSDREFEAGRAESDAPLSEALRKSYVQGSFKDKKGYYYLMGKYEVTKMQYDALMGKCQAKYSMKDTLPISDISFYDAQTASRNFSLYIQQHEKSYRDSFARLPTQSEWEFASRGGNAVNKHEFYTNRPGSNGGNILEYAMLNDAKSSRGKIGPVGRLKPNDLDLYDMLGSVSEMMYDPFNIVRTGRLHGQSGGFVVRGGSFLSNPATVNFAMRSEKPLYKDGKEFKHRAIGMRLVVTKLSIPEQTNIKDLLREQQSLGRGLKQESNIADLDRILKENKAQNQDLQERNDSLVRSLELLKSKMLKSNSEIERLRDEAIVQYIRQLGMACENIAISFQASSAALKNAEINKKAKELVDDKESLRYKNYLKNMEIARSSAVLHSANYNFFKNYYADLVVEIYQNYGIDLIQKFLPEAERRNGLIYHKSQKKTKYNPKVLDFTSILQNYSKNQDLDSLMQQIDLKCVPNSGQFYKND